MQSPGYFRLMFICVFFMLNTACNNAPDAEKSETENEKILVEKFPVFSGEMSYESIKKQLSFGPRIPGSAAHRACAQWLENELKKYCDTVLVQRVETKMENGKIVPLINIVGRFNPDSAQRILLAAHWDSRPWADEDSVNPEKPAPAANSSASGPAVLLEFASVLQQRKPVIGVDIIFFDVQDMGKPEIPNSYCLGSQYWALHLFPENYHANCGIVLNMVGAKDAMFYYEGYSYQNAFKPMSHLWKIANELGYGSRFIPQVTGNITDDHQFVNLNAGIPTLDMIAYDPASKSFPSYWHTHADNIDAVDKKTLKMVGTVITAMIFNPPF